jgi:hypothetical protein
MTGNGDERVVYEELQGPPHTPSLFSPLPPMARRERSTGRAIAIGVVLTLLVVGIAAAFFFTYEHQSSRISHLKGERAQLALRLANTSAALTTSDEKLTIANAKLKKANENLVKANKNLAVSSKQLKQTKADLDAAKSASSDQYSAGYSAGSGSSNATYNSGWDAGYNSGWDYGYNAGYYACAADYYC